MPDSWLADRRRLDRAGGPQAYRQARTKGQPLGPDLLEQVRAEGLPGQVVVADAGDGVSGPFRQGLAERGLTYRVGVTDELVVFPERPRGERPAGRTGAGGRPPSNAQRAAGSPPPVRLRDWAVRTLLRRRTWRAGTKGKRSGRFAGLRVGPGYGWRRGECAGADPLWVRIEEQADGAMKYAVSNRPAGTTCLRALRRWKSRWAVEQGYQQRKEELGLDHFEGRSGRGFHHQACLVLLAYGFLLLEQQRTHAGRKGRGKKGTPSQHGRCRGSGARCSSCSWRCPDRIVPTTAHSFCIQFRSNGVVVEPVS